MLDIDVFAEVGPYFGIGLFGNAAATNPFTNEKETHAIFGGDDPAFRRFDLGAGFRVGTRLLDKYSVFLGYDWGILNVAFDSDDTKVRNSNLNVGIAYRF